MPYSAASLANAFLSRGFQDRKDIDPMKVQKLCYLAHGFALVDLPEPVLNELFEAWKFGPVLPSLYHACKDAGGRPIRRYLMDFDHTTEKFSPTPFPNDPSLNAIVDYVWQNYGDKTGVELSNWTHERNSPWFQTTNGGSKILKNQDIPNEMIRQYFTRYMYVDAPEEGEPAPAQ
jgi:uncharacterized phage-associated protein